MTDSETKTFDIEIAQHSTGEYRVEASTESEAIDVAFEHARNGNVDTKRWVKNIDEVGAE